MFITLPILKMRQRAAQAETADLLSMRHLTTVNSDELCLACMAGDALLAEQLVEEGGALVNWTDRVAPPLDIPSTNAQHPYVSAPMPPFETLDP